MEVLGYATNKHPLDHFGLSRLRWAKLVNGHWLGGGSSNLHSGELGNMFKDNCDAGELMGGRELRVSLPLTSTAFHLKRKLINLVLFDVKSMVFIRYLYYRVCSFKPASPTDSDRLNYFRPQTGF